MLWERQYGDSMVLIKEYKKDGFRLRLYKDNLLKNYYIDYIDEKLKKASLGHLHFSKLADANKACNNLFKKKIDQKKSNKTAIGRQKCTCRTK